MTEITLFQEPRLHNPSLIVGFSGWLDGGEASTGTVKYLVRKLRAKRLGEFPSEDFTVSQMPGVVEQRPHVHTRDGLITQVIYPMNQLFFWQNPRPERGGDLILLLGTEPNQRWRDYISLVLGWAKRQGVQRMCSTGAVLDRTPHTRAPLVSCSVNYDHLRGRMAEYAVQFSNYEGPATFQSTITFSCKEWDIPAIHMTGRSTFYPEYGISPSHNPKVILALVKRLNHLLGLGLNLTDLRLQAQEFQKEMSELTARAEGIEAYLRDLEKNYVEMDYEEPIEGSASEFVEDVEEWLKRRHEDDKA